MLKAIALHDLILMFYLHDCHLFRDFDDIFDLYIFDSIYLVIKVAAGYVGIGPIVHLQCQRLVHHDW